MKDKKKSKKSGKPAVLTGDKAIQFLLAKVNELEQKSAAQERKIASMAAAVDRALREVSTVFADNDKTLRDYADEVNDRLMGLGEATMAVWLGLAEILTAPESSLPVSPDTMPVLTDRFITDKANECRLLRIEAMRKAGIARDTPVPVDTKSSEETEQRPLDQLTQQQLIEATEKIDAEARGEYPAGATFFGGGS